MTVTVGRRRSRKVNRIKNAAAVGIMGLLGIIVFIVLSNHVPREIQTMHALIADTESSMRTIAVSEHIEDNTESIRSLQQHVTDLNQGVPERFESERSQADKLIREMNSLLSELEEVNARIRLSRITEQALASCKAVYTGFTNGSIEAGAALTELEHIRRTRAHTRVTECAAEKITAIRAAVTDQEHKRLKAARDQAGLLTRQGQYRQAIDAIQACSADSLTMLPREDLDLFFLTIKEIEAQALRVFQGLTRKAVLDAAAGDCTAIKERLATEYARFELGILEPDYRAAVQKINAVMAARIKAARAELANDLKSIDGLMARRLYSDALKAYQGLVPRITEKELLREIGRKQLEAGLLAHGKQLIIALINKRKGMEVENLGMIRNAQNDSLELTIDGMTVSISWNRLQDIEMAGMLARTLSETPDAKGFAACGLIHLGAGHTKQADMYFIKALQASAEIRDLYPELLDDSLKRQAMRKEARQAAARARLAARAERNKPREVKPVWRNTGMGGAGGIFTPGVSPVDPDFMLVSSDMSGCYRTDNGGRAWELIHYKEIAAATGCKPFFHPRNVNIVLWKGCISRDKGRTWQSLVTGPGPWGAEKLITHIVCSPDPEPGIFVGTAAGIWAGKAGKGFKQAAAEACGGLALLPNGQVYGAVGNKLYYWEAYMMPPQIVTGPGLSGPIRAIAAGGRKEAPVIHIAGSQGVYTSSNGGRTWEHSLKSRNIVDVVMASVQTTVAYACDRMNVYRTEDKGSEWKACFDLKKNVDVSWVQDELNWGYYIVSNGLNCSWKMPDMVLMTSQAELFLSRDSGRQWRSIVNQKADSGGKSGQYRSIGLEVTATWDYFIAPDDSQRHYISYGDCGAARSADGGNTWSYGAINCPWANTIYSIAFDPFVKERLYAAASRKHGIPTWISIDGDYKPGGVCVSNDRGVTWEALGKGLPGKPCTSVAIHPDSEPGKTILFCAMFGDGIYKSSDSGRTWTKKPGVGRPGNYHVYQVFCHAKSGNVYASTTGYRRGRGFGIAGGLWKSADSGETWQELTADLALGYPTGFAIHPGDSDTVYLAAGTPPGKSQGGVYKTVNGGKTWQHVLEPSDLPGFVHGYSIMIDPISPETVYFSGTQGLWVSRNAGGKWRQFEDLPFQSVSRVRIDPRTPDIMYVTTHGAGVWIGPSAR